MKNTSVKNRRMYKLIIAGIALLLSVIAFAISYSNSEKKSEIAKLVAHQLNKETYELTAADFRKIETLEIKEMELASIKSLGKLTNLKELTINLIKMPNKEYSSTIVKILDFFDKEQSFVDTPFKSKPLGKLKKLEKLNLGCVMYLDNIKSLARLKNLRELTMNGDLENNDYSPLANLEKLEYLDLANANINEINFLDNLTNLKEVSIRLTNITDISPLANLVNLTRLDMSGTDINDLGPLSGLANLRKLYMRDTNIQDITPLKNLTNLTDLNLRLTHVTDYKPLYGLTNLKNLNIEHNVVSDEQIEELKNTLPELEIVR